MENKQFLTMLTTCATLSMVSTVGYAIDLQRGQALHDDECVMCHDSSVYTRENRRVQSLNKLTTQVNMCQEDVGAEWDATKKNDVISYLNRTFYKFATNDD